MNTVIFDVARVILEFEPLPFLHSFIQDEETVRRVHQGLMKSDLWLDMDRGRVEEEDAVAEICRRHPDIQEEIRYAFAHWHSILKPIGVTVDFLKESKAKGYKVYFLSNLHKSTSAFVQKEFAEIWNLFDGGIFSCHTGYIKPEKELFCLLLERYGIDPKDCLYIDDNIENVHAAEELGMQGVHFTDGRELYIYEKTT